MCPFASNNRRHESQGFTMVLLLNWPILFDILYMEIKRLCQLWIVGIIKYNRFYNSWYITKKKIGGRGMENQGFTFIERKLITYEPQHNKDLKEIESIEIWKPKVSSYH